MKFSDVYSRLKSLETLVAEAIAKAGGIFGALRNFVSALNSGGAIGPALAVSWNPGTTITPKSSGNILIIGTFDTQNANANIEVTGQLLRNPTASSGANVAALGGTAVGPAPVFQCGAAGNHDGTVTIAWIDAGLPIGTPVAYGISGTSSGMGNNNTIPISAAQLTYIELP